MLKPILSLALVCSLNVLAKAAPSIDVDYSKFLEPHDMVWDVVPHEWAVAPYSGNGNVGFTLFQNEKDPANAVSLHLGRHDYYDHREPLEGAELNWIYNCRLPLGRFQITTKGDITGADFRLHLWDAELTGKVVTTEGSFQIQALTHSTNDTVYAHVSSVTGEEVSVKWIPDVPFSSVREILNRGGGPKGGSWDKMRTAPYELPPEPTLTKEGDVHFSKQILYKHRGETTTGWNVKKAENNDLTLLASVHHSFPEKNSQEIVSANISKATALIEAKEFFSSHKKWWHEYYPQSFLTLDDPEKEAFYWIQMYKLGSAMRENGPILDLMGPWYKSTFWPMVWGDLNVQLQYWTHLTANRMSLGESLPNNLDKYAFNLEKNPPKSWKDSMHLGACFPQNCLSSGSHTPPDMLAWILHNYWLHCKFEANEERIKNNLFPLMRKTMNGYFNWMETRPVASDDGKLHLSPSWSPEYPAKWDEDCNFTIGLLRWTAQTLLDINKEHGIDDPLAEKWQEVIDTLVDFQIDENGMRIAKNTAFDIPHRHYSHLLPFYPLAIITPESKEDKEMLTKSVDHWLDVTYNSGKKITAMAVTGYTATGASSMYAWLEDSEKAYYYLDFLIKHKNISPNTMYAEGRNPVIESPLSFCTSLHDMLLQSWGRKDPVIRVLPACPKEWPNLAFHKLRAQGSFLVSAKRVDAETQFVHIKSLAGSPCSVKTDIDNPYVTIGSKSVSADTLKKNSAGAYIIPLKKGEEVTFSKKPLSEYAEGELVITNIEVAAENNHLFGYSEKTKRLPSHEHYKKK